MVATKLSECHQKLINIWLKTLIKCLYLFLKVIISLFLMAEHVKIGIFPPQFKCLILL